MNRKTLVRSFACAGLFAAIVTVTGCDADGDGLDDQTGQPIPTVAPDPVDPGKVADHISDLDTPGAGPCGSDYGVAFDESGQVDFASPDTFGFAPGSPCERHLEQWANDTYDQLDELCPSGNFADCHDESGGGR